MLLKESTVQSREREGGGAAADLFIGTLKQLEAFWRQQISDLQGSYSCLQSLEQGVSDFRDLEGRQVAGNVRWNTFSFRSFKTLISAGSLDLFSSSCCWKNIFQHTVATPGPRFNSPVNGLESSALLLQFNSSYSYIFTSSTVILFVWLKRPK